MKIHPGDSLRCGSGKCEIAVCYLTSLRHSQYETELRGALDAVTRDREVEVKRLIGRLEDANALLARTKEEHRAALGAYEAQVARWREESRHLSEKLKGINAENQQVRATCCCCA